jgi:hypothetical protein
MGLHATLAVSGIVVLAGYLFAYRVLAAIP